MKNYHSFSAFSMRSLVATICLAACTITAFAGGKDRYKVYLNNKLLVTVTDVEKLSTSLNKVALSKSNYNDELVIYYWHCGLPEKQQQIALKDEDGKIYHQWKFAQTSSGVGMKIAVKEIVDKLYKSKNKELSLHYYSSEQPPKGRMLAPLVLAEEGIASAAGLSTITVGAAGLVMLATAGGLLLFKNKI